MTNESSDGRRFVMYEASAPTTMGNGSPIETEQLIR